jgi:PiT family inorganic phosphate transporter
VDLALILVGVIIVTALAFDYTNGFHDAANAIATAVGSKSLKPRTALMIAAGGNLVGAFISEGVAKTVGKGIIDVQPSTEGLLVVLAGLIGAITWNLITWWFGLPSSSSHALIGGLAGAALTASQIVHWDGIIAKVLIPMIISPLIGFSLAYILGTGLIWTFRNATRKRATPGFKGAQAVASTAMAVGHGLQDAQKTMGVITLALVVGGFHTGDSIPLWVKIAAATAISLGTAAGGWRIMATLGRRVTEMDLPRGFAAQTVASTVLYVMAIGYQAPISTTHTITSSVLGAGATKGRKFVRWGVVRQILGAWVLTLPASAAVASLAFLILNIIF